MPCKGGYRENIEAGKRRREEEKLYQQSAEAQYWRRLVARVHSSSEGFAQLPPTEKIYYAVSCLIGEVYNGGLHQFFFNHSGSMYGAALAGLYELEAAQTAGLVIQAKELLFGNAPVPADTGERRRLLRIQDASPPGLDELDRAFWRDDEKIGDRCEAYANAQHLY